MRSPKSLLFDDMLKALIKIHLSLITTCGTLVMDQGISHARWQLIWFISFKKVAMTVPDIAKSLGISRQGIQKQIDILLNDGLICLQENPANKRSPKYLISPKGQALHDHIESVVFFPWIEKMSENYDEKDLKKMVSQLDQLSKVFLK